MLYDQKGEEKQLTNKTPYDFSLTQLHWSPNDKQIMFTARKAIYLLTIDSGIITRVTDKNFLVDNPSWSANGQYIYFTSNESGNWQVWRINTAGEELTQITYQGGYGAKESIDGKTLYFYKHQQEGLWQKTLTNDHKALISSDEKLLIKEFSRYAYISWQVFKDGIYFHSFSNGRSTINFKNFSSQNVQLIVEKDIEDIIYSQFSVSHDQKTLLILQGTAQSELLLLKQ